MSSSELSPTPLFELDGFDLDEAFQGAMSDVANDFEASLDDKIRRMENIVTEGSSEIYRDFVDFRVLASQIQMMCGHNHEMNASIQTNEVLSGFMAEHVSPHDHNPAEVKMKDDKKKRKRKHSGWSAFAFQ